MSGFGKLWRRPSLKQIVLSGVGGSVGIVGVLFAVALYIVESLIRPRKRSIFDDYTFSPYELELPGEAVTFSSLRGDHSVSGWYIPREGATTTILVCPGYRSHKSQGLGMAAHLWRAGHNVLLFDYYGHGVPVGKSVTLGYREIHDFLGAVAYAKERAPQTRLGAIGYSMGGAVAIMATAREPAIEALVADSAFATHLSAVNYNVRRVIPMPSTPFVWLADYLLWVRAGYRFHQVEPIRDVSSIAPRPILIIHGEKDSMVDPQDAILLSTAAKEPKVLWQVPNVDHCGAYFADRIAYTQKITNFFNEHLRKPRLQLLESSGEAQSTSSTRNETEGSQQGLSEAS